MAIKVEELDEAQRSLFAQRVTRLEAVSIQLRGLYVSFSECQVAEIQAKADAYNASQASSHGERQGIATASTASLATERLQIKGEIDALEEERDFLKFTIEWIGE